MELFELILLLLICVMASSVLDQMISRMSLPLLQIGIGLAAALLMPHLAHIHVDSELFMILFIAPLLFRESKEADKTALWNNRWSILSMAIALVIASVLAAGFILHWIIPSISLAAAFACAAALGPTDAAAVAALGSAISLTERQSTLLSGEALINDASGVVSFQFAIAAAVTGAFSLAEAAGSFAILFFGGILMGLVLGILARLGIGFLRRRGLVSTTMHVIYEVLSPFLVFLAAEELHVSGILAVVAAGLMMQEPSHGMVSPERARHLMVSNSFWEVIIFLINGVIFVMLGMQLPKVLEPQAMEGIRPATVILAMLAVTAVILVLRWLWITLLECFHKNPESGKRGIEHPLQTVCQSWITTIAGPKGAVTLSIILTIPLVVSSGKPFAYRDLIIFLTSSVILCTLLLADIMLPLMAPKRVDEDLEEQMQTARFHVLEGVIREMNLLLEENAESEYVPAGRLTLMRYRIRLMHQRFAMEGHGSDLERLMKNVLDVQQKRADEIQKDAYETPETERMPYYSVLPEIRASLGYFNGAENVGSRFETRKGRVLFRFIKYRQHHYDDEKAARIYYDTCLFAIDLEHAAINYLKKEKENSDGDRAAAAELLLNEHESYLQSLWGRINYGQDVCLIDDGNYDHGFHQEMPEGMRANTAEQFRMALKYMDEVDANALSIELDQIRRLRAEGRITETVARELREEVYLMQTIYLE